MFLQNCSHLTFKDTCVHVADNVAAHRSYKDQYQDCWDWIKAANEALQSASQDVTDRAGLERQQQEIKVGRR